MTYCNSEAEQLCWRFAKISPRRSLAMGLKPQTPPSISLCSTTWNWNSNSREMHINFPSSFLEYPPAWNNFALRQNWGVFVWQKGWQEENLGLGSRHKSCVQREADTATIPLKRHYSFDISFFMLNNLISTKHSLFFAGKVRSLHTHLARACQGQGFMLLSSVIHQGAVNVFINNVISYQY